MKRPLVLALLASVAPLASALAAPATPEEATRLTALFERYIGHPADGQPGSVTVVPKGDSYVVTLDSKRAMQNFERFGITVDPNVSATTLTPLPDGTWKVVSDPNPPPLIVHIKGQVIALKSATSTFEGIYDPKIYGFKTAASTAAGYDYTQTSPQLVQNRHLDKVDMALQGVPAEGGTTSVTAHYVTTGTTSDILVKSIAPAGTPAEASPIPPNTAINYTASSSTIDFAVDRLHTKELLDLWAFFVAHPDKPSITAAQGQLREILQAGLPFLDKAHESTNLAGFALKSSFGNVTAQNFGGDFDLQDLSAKGKLSTSLSYDGLVLQTDQLPPWLTDFVPTSLSLKLGLDGFHAREAAAEAVNDVQLDADEPLTPDQTAKVGRLFWPGNGTFTLAPSRITSKLVDLKMEGGGIVGPEPSGHVTITGTGLDKAIAELQAASTTDPSAAQMLNPLVLAKNLAKPNPDGSLVWVVEALPDGTVTVNGAPMQ